MTVKTDTGPFSIIPEWVLDAKVSDRAIRLYCVLARYAENESGTAFPSRKTLADRLQGSVDKVDRAKAELVDIGALVVEERRRDDGDQTSNLYTLIRVRPGGRKSAATPGRTDAALTRTTSNYNPPTPQIVEGEDGVEWDDAPTREEFVRGPGPADRSTSLSEAQREANLEKLRAVREDKLGGRHGPKSKVPVPLKNPVEDVPVDSEVF